MKGNKYFTIMDDSRIEINQEAKSLTKLARITYFIIKLFINPFVAGVTGFTLFFLIAILFDFVVNLFVPDKLLTIDIYTVLIGAVGFFLAFLYSLLDSIQN